MAGQNHLGRRISREHRQELLETADELFALGHGVVVIASELEEQFWFIGAGKIFLRMMKADQAIAAAVHNHHGNFQARKFGASVVLDAPNQPDGKPGEQLGPDVRNAGKSTLQNQASEGFANGEFAADSSAE